jgi:hypothetical protein
VVGLAPILITLFPQMQVPDTELPVPGNLVKVTGTVTLLVVQKQRKTARVIVRIDMHGEHEADKQIILRLARLTTQINSYLVK